MKGYAKFLVALGALSVVAFGPARVQAAATLQGDYFKMSNNSPDVQGGIDGGVVTGLVETVLGPNGLPVASAYGKTYAGPSGPISDIDPVTGEIRWWSTASPYVQFEKTQVDTMPLNTPTGFFPDGQTGDSPYYRTVRWQGTFNLASPGAATFALSADDDAFLFIDNQLVIDNGGVKAVTAAPNVTSNLAAGSHKVDLFFSDRHAVESGITFTTDTELTPVPEPSSMALLGMGLPALLALRRRSR